MGYHELKDIPHEPIFVMLYSHVEVLQLFSLGTEISVYFLSLIHHTAPLSNNILCWGMVHYFKQWSCTETLLTPEVQNSH